MTYQHAFRPRSGPAPRRRWIGCISGLVASAAFAGVSTGSAQSSPHVFADPSLLPTPSLESRGQDVGRGLSLVIETTATSVVSGQAIVITATLQNVADHPITATVGQASPVLFSLDQVDGPLDMAPDRGPITSVQMDVGESVVYPFIKSGGYTDDDPLAPFWKTWFADPQLRLPPGVYRIVAQSQLLDVDGRPAHEGLEAAVVIAVTGAEPLPSAGASSMPSGDPPA